MFSACLTIDCLRSFCLVKSKHHHLDALGIVSMMLRCMTVRTVILIGHPVIASIHKINAELNESLQSSCNQYTAHLREYTNTLQGVALAERHLSHKAGVDVLVSS